MTEQQRIKNLSVPTGAVDVVLDTDAYNEVDDQYAIAYLLRSGEKLRTRAIYAAPFLNALVESPAEGMEKSYEELQKILGMLGERVPTLRGSTAFLTDEQTPICSDAAKDLAARAEQYSPDHPLYVVAIGAITNVASAILLNPKVAENTVVVWLGGHARHYHDTAEFNMREDIAAARVVFGSGVPLVQLPCRGVVSEFRVSEPELRHWLEGRGALADYLVEYTVATAERYAAGTAWTRVIWDVTAVAWLLNDGDRFLRSQILQTQMPTYDHQYAAVENALPMAYVYSVNRDALMTDLFRKLTARA